MNSESTSAQNTSPQHLSPRQATALMVIALLAGALVVAVAAGLYAGHDITRTAGADGRISVCQPGGGSCVRYTPNRQFETQAGRIFFEIEWDKRYRQNRKANRPGKKDPVLR